MFRECLQCLEEIVGSHSTTYGCRIDRLLVALTEVVLPLYGIHPCATMVCGVLRLASLENSGMECQTLVATANRVDRISSRAVEVLVASGVAAAEGWIEKALDDVELRRRLTMVPGRTLQHRVAGLAPSAFVSSATDAALDLLGEHLLHGLPLSDLRAGVLRSRAPSEFSAAMATLWDNGVVTSAALVTPGIIREHLVFRHADAALDLADDCSGSVTRRWLAFVRSSIQAGIDVAQTGFEAELHEFATAYTLGDAAVAEDPEDQPLSVVYANDRRRANVGASTGRFVVGRFVEDRVLTAEFRRLMTEAYQHLADGSVKPGDEVDKKPMPPVNLIWALTVRIAEHYGTTLTRSTKDLSTTALHRRIAELRLADPVRVARTTSDYAYVPVDERRRVRDYEIVAVSDQDGSVMPTEWFVPMGRQVLCFATHSTVMLDSVKPPYVTMRDLASRVRSLAATDEFRNRVEVTASRCADSKSFTVTVRPTVTYGSASRENDGAALEPAVPGSSGSRKSRDGVSQWAREQLLAKLRNTPCAGVTLEELQADLDTKTLRRLIHQLKTEGLVHTTSFQPQGKRLQGIVCLASCPPPTDDEKRRIVEAAAARRTSAASGSAPVSAASKQRNATRDCHAAVTVVKVERSNEPGSEPKPAIRVRGRSAVKPLLGSRVRAAVCLARNGYCSNFTARCWRLHLQLCDLSFGPFLRHRRAAVESQRQSTTPHATKFEESDAEGPLDMTVGDILEHMSLSTFCIVLGFSADDVARYFPVGDVRGIPWGASVRHLPFSLMQQCHAHPKHGLFAVLQGLAARGVIESTLDTEVLEQRRLYHAPTDAACRISLNRCVTAADGTTWRIYDEQDPTSTMARISAFWSLHEVAEPITAAPSIKPARKAALQRLVKATNGKPSATELFVISRLLRVRLIVLATYCLQAGADMSQLAQASDVHRHLFGGDEGTVTGHAAETTLLRRFTDHVGAVDGAGGSSESADDEGNSSDPERGPTRRRAARRGRLFRKSAASVTQGDVYAALRIAVLGDDYLAVLLRIRRLVTNLSPVYQTIIGVVVRLLQALDATAQDATPAASAAVRRAQRLEVLDSVWRPTGGDAGLPPSRGQPTTEAEDHPAARASEVRAAHREVIRCILFSRAAHSSRAHRDALLREHGLIAPDGGTVEGEDALNSVCLELRRQYPNQFCRGSQLNDQHTYDRLRRLLLPSRVVHVPTFFACDSLATSLVARAAHRLLRSSLRVTAAAACVAEDVDAHGEVELVRQPIVDLHAFAHEPMEERYFDVVFLPTLEVPEAWQRLEEEVHRPVAQWWQEHQKSRDDVAAQSTGEGAAFQSLPFRVRDPPRALWREQSSTTSRNTILLQLPPEVDDVLPAVPPGLRGTSCAHMDGTWNAFVVATEVARMRAALLSAPGVTRRQLIHRLCADGHTGAAVVLWLLERLVSDGVVLSRWNAVPSTPAGMAVLRLRPHAVTRAPHKRQRNHDGEREDEYDENGTEVAYWWNVAWASATVCAHPLGMVVSLERASVVPHAVCDDERRLLDPVA